MNSIMLGREMIAMIQRSVLLPVLLLIWILSSVALSGEPYVLLNEWSDAGGKPLELPVDLAVRTQSGENQLLVLDQSQDPSIQIYSFDGQWVKAIPLKEAHLPGGIAVGHDGKIFVSDLDRDVVLRYSPDGAYEKVWGGFGEEGGRYNNPRDLAVDKDNFLYVGDEGNQRIVKTDSDGNVQLVFNKPDNIRLFEPNALLVMPDGRVLAGFTGSRNFFSPVCIWSPDGTFKGWQLFWSELPRLKGLALSDAGELYFSSFCSAIKRENAEKFINAQKPYGLPAIYGNVNMIPRHVYSAIVAQPDSRNLFVVDQYAHRILQIGPDPMSNP